MTPTEAGFDGAKGVSLNISYLPDGGYYKLRRGNFIPDPHRANLRNQLLWYAPDDGEPKLCYCNHDNQLFELSFTPMEL